MTLEVLRPGLLDLVMDFGRPGFRDQGVPAGGAADPVALALANRLVGNPEQAAGLELLLRGPALHFPLGARIALTGASMPGRLDGEEMPTGQTVEVPAGAVLELGMAQQGLRSYLAVAGGLDVPLLMRSRSTFLPGGFGGWRGRPLQSGDVLPVGGGGSARRGRLQNIIPVPHRLRVLPGPQIGAFADAAIKDLAGSDFSVSADANRLGLRLDGPLLSYGGGELLSQAVLPGAIQVPPTGRPIILGWDGPVTGGYPVVAGVIAADLPRLAQLRPGDGLGFCFVSPDEAQAAWEALQDFMNEAIVWEN